MHLPSNIPVLACAKNPSEFPLPVVTSQGSVVPTLVKCWCPPPHGTPHPNLDPLRKGWRCANPVDVPHGKPRPPRVTAPLASQVFNLTARGPSVQATSASGVGTRGPGGTAALAAFLSPIFQVECFLSKSLNSNPQAHRAITRHGCVLTSRPLQRVGGQCWRRTTGGSGNPPCPLSTAAEGISSSQLLRRARRRLRRSTQRCGGQGVTARPGEGTPHSQLSCTVPASTGPSAKVVSCAKVGTN